MAFAKVSSSQLETTDLEQLVRETGALILPTRQFNLEIKSDESLPSVVVDRSQIEQVVANLLINASQSYSDGGIIRVHLSNESLPSDPERNAVRIQIQDEGCGIEEKDLGRIFEPYFSTKRDGHGLGLSTSYYFIVQRHGGEIDVNSKPGVGTTINVFIPEDESKSAPEKIPQVPTNSLRILIVDDEPTVQKGVGALIESLGHLFLAASDCHRRSSTLSGMQPIRSSSRSRNHRFEYSQRKRRSVCSQSIARN